MARSTADPYPLCDLRYFGGRQLLTKMWDGVTNYAQIKVRQHTQPLISCLRLLLCLSVCLLL